MNHEFWDIYDKYIQREGADSLKAWLLSTDFETAPASTMYHNAFEGGLITHSVNVWKELVRLLKAYPEVKVSAETAAIVSLLHDLCKIGCYKTELRNTKVNGVWVQKPTYVFNEDFCFGGHGSKSVYLAQRHINLTPEEATAINCHMASWDRGVNDYNVGRVYEHSPLAWLLHVADESAAYIRESNRTSIG